MIRSRSSIASNRRRNARFYLETLESRCLLAGDFVITEFVASNQIGARDDDGDRSDWIEAPQPRHGTARPKRLLSLGRSTGTKEVARPRAHDRREGVRDDLRVW